MAMALSFSSKFSFQPKQIVLISVCRSNGIVGLPFPEENVFFNIKFRRMIAHRQMSNSVAELRCMSDRVRFVRAVAVAISAEKVDDVHSVLFSKC